MLSLSPNYILDTTIIISGYPYTKKNNARVYGNRYVTSHNYQKWANKAYMELARLGHPDPIDFPVNVEVHFYLDNNRRSDIVNLLQGPLDILVDAGILADDSYKVVTSMDGTRVHIDPQEARTEIIITRI